MLGHNLVFADGGAAPTKRGLCPNIGKDSRNQAKVYQGSDGSWYGYELSCRPEQGERDLFQVRETLASEGFTELHVCPWA